MSLNQPFPESQKALFWQIIRFAIIGIMASAWHFMMVYLLVSQLQQHPLIANIFAFFSAFLISYFGHSLWTFKEKKHNHNHVIKKFFLVAVFGFILNEGGYFLLLSFTSFSYLLSLLIVLLVVPLITFIMSKYWAFQ